MLTMVGFTTIAWAWAEHALEHMIWNIDSSGAEIRGHKQIPVSLNNKLDYMKKALADVPSLKVLEKDGRALVELFVSMKKRRGDIVHGAMFRTTGLGVFESFTFDTKGRAQTLTKAPVTIPDIVLFNQQVLALANEANAFLRRVLKALA